MKKILFLWMLPVATAVAQAPCTTFPTDAENTDYRVRGFRPRRRVRNGFRIFHAVLRLFRAV